MKRQPTPKPTEQEAAIVRWFTLFEWTQCSMCELEFRRESGWRSDAYFPFGRASRFSPRYACPTCSPTRQQFWDWMNEGDKRLLPKGGSGTAPPKPQPPPIHILTKGEGA